MFSAIDSTGFEQQPELNHNFVHVAFFLCAVFFMGEYFVGLFVGIVFQTYIKVKSSMRTGMSLSDEERRWFDFQVSPLILSLQCLSFFVLTTITTRIS